MVSPSDSVLPAFELLQTGQFKAAELLLSALPKSLEVWLCHALLAHRQGDSELGLEQCEHALEAGESAGTMRALTWLTKGSLHARLGQRVNALECYRRALRLCPDWAAAAHMLTSAGGRGFEAPLRAEVEHLFDRYAGRFETHLVESLNYDGYLRLPDAVRRVSGRTTADWTVMDLGCGSGLCAGPLRPLAQHLTGLDLSADIVREAADKGYDLVYQSDLVFALVTTLTGSLDLLLSADVLGYVGRLEAVFEESHRTLVSGGYLAFSVESWGGSEDFVMGSSRRCAFQLSYLERLATEYGFAVRLLEEAVLRREAGEGVSEHLVVLQKRAASAHAV